MAFLDSSLAGAVGRLARGCARHRGFLLVAWIIVLASAALYVRGAGAQYTQQVAPTGSESDRALTNVTAISPGGQLPDVETIVVRAREGTLDDRMARDRMTLLIAQVGKLPGVALVADPSGPLGPATVGVTPISADRRTAMISVVLKGTALAPDLAAVRRVQDLALAYDDPQFQVEMSGPGITAIETAGISTTPLIFALLAGLLLVIAAVRSPSGLLICLVSGAVAATLAVAATAKLAHTVVMTPFAPMVAGLLAFGICLGGAVVIVYRAQSALLRGEDGIQAAETATATSGAALAVGGLSLTVAMAVVSIVGLSGFRGIALAAAAVGTITILVVLTLLPALLGLAGARLLGWTERRFLSVAGAGLGRRPGLRSWWAAQVGRYPAPVAVVAGVLLVGLTVQASSIRLGGGDSGAEPTSTTSRRAYDLVSEGFFPGLNGPVLVAVRQAPAKARPAARSVTSADVAAALTAAPGVRNAAVMLEDTAKGLAVIRVLPQPGPRSEEASALIRQLRTEVLPAVLRDTATTADVGGPTALFDDAAAGFRGSVVALLCIVLLTVALVAFVVSRSAVLAALLGLSATLSVQAAGGVLTILFQNERFAERLGVMVSPVEPFVLVPVFVAVLGLAPGMNLVLLGRLREQNRAASDRSAGGPSGNGQDRPRERAGGRRSIIRSARDGIARGHAELGHVVLTMNMVMLLVAVAIAAQPPRTLKMMGFGLAAGVAVDALVLRVAALPAIAHLFRLSHAENASRPSRQDAHTAGRTDRPRRARRANPVTVEGIEGSVERQTVPTTPLLVGRAGDPGGNENWNGHRTRTPGLRSGVPPRPRTPAHSDLTAQHGNGTLYFHEVRVPRDGRR
ncbi:hypothetical protein CcI49_04385 [Frankia sp. CcI49]|uniref:MMPL family transporter n=1 Tax=unclassified Frankia TaxID=2632575 RepID=UPI0009CBDCF4|nr:MULTISPECIES: MMPL family transporter [unclassified Frankia]ONH61476.1 hypothetical protein CcI49_04385 [Frankia sp. CcI49]